MKDVYKRKHCAFFIGIMALLTMLHGSYAYPPAPPHVIFGMARGEDGEPISNSSSIIFKTEDGVVVNGTVAQNLEPGVNYEVVVPMDANTITNVPYVSNALTPLVPFRISVVIGATTNIPLQMQGDYHLLGEEGGETRIDLTLGVDSDGDGLPDAWEQFIIDALGGGLTLQDITPFGDNDGDGLTNYEEYLAGTYAFDSQDTFKLYVKERTSDTVVFEFLGVAGHTYTIQKSENLIDWTTSEFVVPKVGSFPLVAYPASTTKTVTVEVVSTNQAFLYRGIVQ